MRSRAPGARPSRFSTLCVATLALAGGVAACGSAARPDTTTSQTQARATKALDTIDVYSSLPREGSQGPEGRSIVNGIRAGLRAGEAPAGRIGEFRVNYISMNDANAAGWNQELVVRNARRAASDPHAVLFIGDLDSGATELSLPILNQAGIVQITPGSPYPGLTNDVTGVTAANEPKKFYPGNTWTLLRLVPDDMVQASAALDALRSQVKCERVAAVSVGSAIDGPAIVKGIKVTARSYGMTYLPATLAASDSTAAEAAFIQSLKLKSVQCLVLAGHTTAAAVSLATAFHAEFPADTIVATAGLCNQDFTNASDGGVPAALDKWVYCTSPALPLSSYGSGATAFINDYHRVFGRNRTPSPYAAYGFVAGELAADAIADLGYGADNRLAVQHALLDAGVVRGSALIGTFSFDSRGNINTRRFGLFSIDAHGVPAFYGPITPTTVVGPG